MCEFEWKHQSITKLSFWDTKISLTANICWCVVHWVRLFVCWSLCWTAWNFMFSQNSGDALFFKSVSTKREWAFLGDNCYLLVCTHESLFDSTACGVRILPDRFQITDCRSLRNKSINLRKVRQTFSVLDLTNASHNVIGGGGPTWMLLDLVTLVICDQDPHQNLKLWTTLKSSGEAQFQNEPQFCIPLDWDIHFQVPVKKFLLLHFLPEHQGNTLCFWEFFWGKTHHRNRTKWHRVQLVEYPWACLHVKNFWPPNKFQSPKPGTVVKLWWFVMKTPTKIWNFEPLWNHHEELNSRMNHSFVFHWTGRFISKCQLKNFCCFTFCQNTKAFVFLGVFLRQNTSSEQNQMTPCTTCRVPLGMFACKIFPASNTWNWDKTLVICDQDLQPNSETLNPSEIIMRSSIPQWTTV